MDVTVIEELQIHTPLKTERKTSAQDEILQAAAAASGNNGASSERKNGHEQQRCHKVHWCNFWKGLSDKKKIHQWTMNFREPQQRLWLWMYLFIFFLFLSKMKTSKSYTAFLMLFFDLITKYFEFCIILMVTQLVAQSRFKFRQPRKLTSVRCVALKY